MKDNRTHLALLVDRSGSMSTIREDAEGGLKELIKEQRELPGELTIELFQFDTHYEKVTDIDAWSLQPRGSTALLDSMGRAITEVGETLAAMPEEERPGKVVFVIVTDGQENSSREWTREKVFEAVTRQSDQYAWQFVFNAANQDAIAEAGSLGVRNAMNFQQTGQSVQSAYTTTSSSIAAYRGGATAGVDVPEDAPEPSPSS